MFRPLVQALHGEISAGNILNNLHQIHGLDYRYSYSNFHKTAEYCAGELSAIGATDVEVLPYPADGKTTFMDCVMPMAWDVEDARLEIVSPAGAGATVLADWRSDPFVIGMWSTPTPPGGVVSELITEEEMLAGKDIAGKIVLNSPLHHPRLIKREVARRGGIGVVSDWSENYLDTADGVYWNNEWSQTSGGWYGGTTEDMEESPIWCISISPRTGLSLRRLLHDSPPVMLRATVDTRLYEGTLDVVTGIIPGDSSDAGEVLLLAHLYEPMPTDNAAGAAVVIEALRAIKSLIDRGVIPRPLRSIRALFAQERFGFTAYIDTHPEVRSLAVAAVNVDDPCCSPEVTGVPVTVITNPDCQSSFADVLFQDIAAHCLSTYMPTVGLKVKKGTGSDDTFLCDPTIGIPVNWMTALPGRYHHNSLNDSRLVDPKMLRVNAIVNTAFSCFVAGAGEREALWLGSRIVTEAWNRYLIAADEATQLLAAGRQSAEETLVTVFRQIKHIQEAETNRVMSLGGIADMQAPGISTVVDGFCQQVSEASEVALESGVQRIRLLSPSMDSVEVVTPPLTDREQVAENMIPARKYSGVPVTHSFVPKDQREAVISKGVPYALFWADGKRNLLEIIRAVENDRKVPIPNIRGYVSYFTALVRYGYTESSFRVVLRKDDIISAVEEIGVRPGDVILMHSSLSRAGHIEGGADTVIEALMEVLGPEGTLIMPTNYDNGVVAVSECGLQNTYPPGQQVAVPWNPRKSRAHTGEIPNAFWKCPDVLRSNHPTHSVAAWGKLADKFVHGHEPGTSGCGRQGPYGKMVDNDGKFLYFAVNLNTTTFWHALDDWLDLPYLPTADVLMEVDGRVEIVKAPKYPEGHRCFYTPNPHKILQRMQETGVEVRQVPLGLSDLKVVQAREYYEKLFPVLQRETDLFLCDNHGCRFCAWARLQIQESSANSDYSRSE